MEKVNFLRLKDKTEKFQIVLFIAFLLIFSTSGCISTNPTTGQRVFTADMTTQDEINIGRQNHPQITKLYGGVYENKVLSDYVESVGQLLAQTVERRNFQYKFTILNSPVVNAFALPGGYIYVSRGLLALASDEAEMAAVLAHELGHINALHHARRRGTTFLAEALISGIAVTAGKEAAQVSNLISSGLLSAWSREDEIESDSLALRYLSRAGFDPKASVDFLSKLRAHALLEAKREGKSPGSIDQFDYLGTHPAPIKRIQTAERQVPKYNQRISDRGREIYLRKIDGMLYGDDPSQGLVQGRVFAHPKLRFRFEVPANFTLFNLSNSVIARGPGQTKIIFDQATRPSDGPVSYYLKNVWGRNTTLQDLEKLTINGMKAATGSAALTVNGNRLDARFVAIRKDLHTIYRFLFLSEPGQKSRYSIPFRRTTHSFRLLTEPEVGTLKPLRIRVHKAQSGDTVDSLSRKMVSENGHELERLRVLNGLRPQDQISTGDKIKLVQE